jgi:nickel transport protein
MLISSKNATRLAAISLLTAVSANAVAHEYWIEKEVHRYVLQQGHKSTAHAGAAAVPFDPAIVAQTVCTDKSGRTQTLAHKGSPPAVEADCARISFQLSSGYWTKTPYDTINRPRTEVKGALQSWLSQETVTRIDLWTPALNKPAYPGLALVPLANPAALKPGDKFTLQALLDGKPAAGVPVAYDGETRGATDGEGRINLRVRHGGLQQVSASLETPLNDGKAETLIRGATLNFVLP